MSGDSSEYMLRPDEKKQQYWKNCTTADIRKHTKNHGLNTSLIFSGF
jgi:hypothetical protein